MNFETNQNLLKQRVSAAREGIRNPLLASPSEVEAVRKTVSETLGMTLEDSEPIDIGAYAVWVAKSSAKSLKQFDAYCEERKSESVDADLSGRAEHLAGVLEFLL